MYSSPKRLPQQRSPFNTRSDRQGLCRPRYRMRLPLLRSQTSSDCICRIFIDYLSPDKQFAGFCLPKRTDIFFYRHLLSDHNLYVSLS